MVDNTVFYITNNRKIPLIFVSIKQNTAIDNNKAGEKERKAISEILKFTLNYIQIKKFASGSVTIKKKFN